MAFKPEGYFSIGNMGGGYSGHKNTLSKGVDGDQAELQGLVSWGTCG